MQLFPEEWKRKRSIRMKVQAQRTQRADLTYPSYRAGSVYSLQEMPQGDQYAS